MHANCSPFVLRCCQRTRISALAASSGLILALGLITSCSNSPSPSNEQLEQKTAQAAKEVKQDSREALADAQVAAAKAEDKVNAITSGVKQGINDKTGVAPSGSSVDLNTASEDDLAALPGISRAKAGQIIRRRPYDSTRQLVSRGLLSHSQFDQIAGDVTVR